MKSVFTLKMVEVVTPQYPTRKLEERRLGIFTSVEKACDVMRRGIAERKQREEESGYDKTEYEFESEIFGFAIEEICLDVMEDCIWVRTYDRNGNLNDECRMADKEEPNKLLPYHGRAKENIRFHPGDIVEVWHGRVSELCIVCNSLPTTEDYEKYRQRIEGLDEPAKRKFINWDYTEDSYLVFSLGGGDTHMHPLSAEVFRPTMEVPPVLKQKLQEKLAEMIESYGYPRL